MAVHAARRRHGVNVVAMERVPHALAVHVFPKRAQLFRLRMPKVAHRHDARAVKAFFHPLADARNVFERQANNGSGIGSGGQIVTPFGLSTLHAIFASKPLAAKPIEQVIWLADISADPALDSRARALGRGNRRSIELAGEFVNRLHRLNRNLAADFVEQGVDARGGTGPAAA